MDYNSSMQDVCEDCGQRREAFWSDTDQAYLCKPCYDRFRREEDDWSAMRHSPGVYSRHRDPLPPAPLDSLGRIFPDCG